MYVHAGNGKNDLNMAMEKKLVCGLIVEKKLTYSQDTRFTYFVSKMSANIYFLHTLVTAVHFTNNHTVKMCCAVCNQSSILASQLYTLVGI